MRNTYLVAKQALLVTIRTKSFWVISLLVPAFLLAFQVFNALREGGIDLSNPEAETSETGTVESEAAAFQVGLVDEARLMQVMPPEFPAGLFLLYADLAEAKAALKAGTLDQVLYLPADYLTSGQVVVYDYNFAILPDGSQAGMGFGGSNDWMLKYILAYNLTRDAALSQALLDPLPAEGIEYHDLQPEEQVSPAGNPALAILVGRVVPFLFYMILIFGSSYLLGAVTNEKENRTAEVLLLSVQPRQFMLGKVLGMGVVTLIQLVIWLGGAFFAMKRSAPILGLTGFDLPPDFWMWAVVYLLLGYFVYGGIMAAVGAISPNTREANQTIWLIVLPQLPALMFASEFAENPNGPLAVFLSIFPLSAPGAMVTRIAVTEVPAWQLALSLILLAATAWGMIWLAARFFQSGNLLSNTSFSYRRLWSGWRN
jgi:ABC-2 type transport system permease protein